LERRGRSANHQILTTVAMSPKIPTVGFASFRAEPFFPMCTIYSEVAQEGLHRTSVLASLDAISQDRQ
jgi:hypothetical protein